jgi:hypothetical protein
MHSEPGVTPHGFPRGVDEFERAGLANHFAFF